MMASLSTTRTTRLSGAFGGSRQMIRVAGAPPAEIVGAQRSTHSAAHQGGAHHGS